jgi:hypothetical protein
LQGIVAYYRRAHADKCIYIPHPEEKSYIIRLSIRRRLLLLLLLLLFLFLLLPSSSLLSLLLPPLLLLLSYCFYHYHYYYYIIIVTIVIFIIVLFSIVSIIIYFCDFVAKPLNECKQHPTNHLILKAVAIQRRHWPYRQGYVRPVQSHSKPYVLLSHYLISLWPLSSRVHCNLSVSHSLSSLCACNVLFALNCKLIRNHKFTCRAILR